MYRSVYSTLVCVWVCILYSRVCVGMCVGVFVLSDRAYLAKPYMVVIYLDDRVR